MQTGFRGGQKRKIPEANIENAAKKFPKPFTLKKGYSKSRWQHHSGYQSQAGRRVPYSLEPAALEISTSYEIVIGARVGSDAQD